jgi:hypothetical protein
MFNRIKVIVILVFIIRCSDSLFGQDTIFYRGYIPGKLLIETLELYPNKTFKWTSEYDLSYSQYGVYNLANDNLELKYYLAFNPPKVMSLNDTIELIDNPIKIENFKVEKDNLFRLTNSGREIHRIKDSSLRSHCSLIFGHKYEIKK